MLLTTYVKRFLFNAEANFRCKIHFQYTTSAIRSESVAHPIILNLFSISLKSGHPYSSCPSQTWEEKSILWECNQYKVQFFSRFQWRTCRVPPSSCLRLWKFVRGTWKCPDKNFQPLWSRTWEAPKASLKKVISNLERPLLRVRLKGFIINDVVDFFYTCKAIAIYSF